MLDDSLSAGRLDPPKGPAAPTVTLNESHDDLVEALERHGKGRLAVGDRFASYQIRGVLGHGPMGFVYEAWDPANERRVTLKLVRSPTERAAERLLREARALARIDHPNIVRILAAEVHRGAVYLVMELVEGQDLREWMQSPHPWGEALCVMIGAGRGLAAAHAVGILHRDFRPENVLVGWDGQARVLDFGIARMSPDHPEHETIIAEQDEDEPGVEEGVCGSAPLVGSFADMPLPERGEDEPRSLRDALAYMAPEQHERERADERSDQFGFCATLFEAVYGAHPFPGKDLLELALRASEGRAAFPARSGAPRWLQRVLSRGLSPQRDDRFATMEDLLEALARYPGRRRRRKRVAGFLALGLGVAGLVGFVASRSPETSVCANFEEELSQRALGDATRSTLALQLAAPELGEDPAAAALAERLVGGLEAWSATWLGQREASCLRRQDNERETSTAEARERCLSRQADRVAALVTVLADDDVERFVTRLAHTQLALELLPDPNTCTLATATGPNKTSTNTGAAAPEPAPELDAQLLALRWQTSLWPDADALAAAQAALVRAEEQSDGPALLEAQLALGRAQIHAGHPQPALAVLRAGLWQAERSRQDLMRAELSIEVGRALSLMPGRSHEALARLDDTAALLERVDAPAWLRSRHAHTRVDALLGAGELERARELLDAQLLAVQDDALAPLVLARAHLQLARMHCEALDARDCLREAEAGRDALQAAFGPAHVELAPALALVGRAFALLEQEDEAIAILDRALLLHAEAVPKNRSTAELRRALTRTLVYRAELALALDDATRAADTYREALALTPEADFGARASLLFALARGHELAGRSEQALANYSETLRLAERAVPRDEGLVARTRFAHARTLLATGETDAAHWALARCQKEWPPELADDPDAARLSTTLRQLEAAAGQTEDLTKSP